MVTRSATGLAALQDPVDGLRRDGIELSVTTVRAAVKAAV
jgi:hypothetical protein